MVMPFRYRDGPAGVTVTARFRHRWASPTAVQIARSVDEALDATDCVG
jgi:hypothetical protein